MSCIFRQALQKAKLDIFYKGYVCAAYHGIGSSAVIVPIAGFLNKKRFIEFAPRTLWEKKNRQ